MTVPSKEHSGHRQRLRSRAIKYGIDSLEDHEFLEMLLFNVIPRKNTNPTAHHLLDKFGSMSDIFEASEDELQKAGLPKKAAFWIAHLNDFTDMYLEHFREENAPPDQIVAKANSYIIEQCAKFREKAYKPDMMLVVSISVRGTVRTSEWIKKNDDPDVNVNTVCREAIENRAYYVMIVHTNPADYLMPSEEECCMTEKYDKALTRLQMVLLDRYHVTPSSCSSYSKVGSFFVNADDFYESVYYRLMNMSRPL